MALKVKLTDIPPSGLDLTPMLTIAEVASWHADQIEKLNLAEPITGRLNLTMSGERLLLRGQVATTIIATCSRCLEEFNLPLMEEIFSVFVHYPPEAALAIQGDEDQPQDIIRGEEIDLWPVMQEYLFLALPIKPLCREDCRGLCPSCGHNQNSGPCQCQPMTRHPGLAALKDLWEKKKES